MLVILIFAEIGYLLIEKRGGWTREEQITTSAHRVVDLCKHEDHRPSCYDREIPKLMKRFTMEESFMITKIVQTKDPAYAYCHVLGHAISAQETKKDPSLWKEVITRCPSGVCSNGCVHGAFQERFRTDVLTRDEIEKIKPDLESVCEPRGTWNPTGMVQATCYHALGHLLMYITGADISESTALCDEVAGPKNDDGDDHRQVCYDGTFMQVFQPLEPEDIALVKDIQPTRDTVEAFCRPYTQERLASCVNESWPLYQKELQDPAFMPSFCGRLPDGLANRCYTGMFYILVVQFQFNLDSMKTYCEGLPGDLQGRCFAATASRLIETDWQNTEKAVAWCHDNEAHDPEELCYKEIAQNSGFNFHPDSPQFIALCNALPASWKDTCFNRESTGQPRPVTQ